MDTGTFVKPTFEELTGNLKPVFELMSFPTKGQKHQKQRHMVFGSIVKAALRDPENEVFFISKKEKYNAEKYPVSHNCFLTVKAAMEAQGWLALVPRQIAKDGLSRRWKVSQSLIDLVVGLELEWVDRKPERERKAKHQLVEVRYGSLAKYLSIEGHKLPVPTHTQDDLDTLREQMAEINELASLHTFTGLVSKKGEPKSFTGYYRIFNHTLERGGRTYTGFEVMREKDRLEQIKIDGEPVAEIDIKSCQPNILFAQTITEYLPYEGAPTAKDFYSLVVARLGNIVQRNDVLCYRQRSCHLSREQVKGIVTKALGKGALPQHRWPRGTKVAGVSWKEEVLPVFHEVMPFMGLLQPIKMDGLVLQNLEADIVFSTLYGLYKHRDIPTIPVHDALICKQSDAEAVTNALKLSFWFKTGLVPLIEVKKHMTGNR